jgi:hypothetical protein
MDMTEAIKHRAVIFFTSSGSYHVYTDPGVEVLIGHEELSEYVIYKDRPIEEWFLDDAPILFPPESPDELDPVNKLVLELA